MHATAIVRLNNYEIIRELQKLESLPSNLMSTDFTEKSYLWNHEKA